VCGVANPGGLHLTFTSPHPGEVRAEVTIAAEFQGYPGIVHGGIIAALLDEAAGRAFMTPDLAEFFYTARLEVRYRRKTPVGQPLRLEGRAGTRSGRTAHATSALFAPDGELLAEADAVLVAAPPLGDPAELAEAGWRVYADAELQAAADNWRPTP
jgi:acyl-coenzyme A thioesterase PaaI-like protein